MVKVGKFFLETISSEVLCRRNVIKSLGNYNKKMCCHFCCILEAMQSICEVKRNEVKGVMTFEPFCIEVELAVSSESGSSSKRPPGCSRQHCYIIAM